MDKLFNTAKEIEVGGKVREVKELTFLQLSALRQKAAATWCKRFCGQAAEIAKSMEKEDRLAFLLAAARQRPTDEEVQFISLGEDGVRWVLAMALGEPDEMVGRLLANPAQFDTLRACWEAAMGVQPTPDPTPEDGEKKGP